MTAVVLQLAGPWFTSRKVALVTGAGLGIGLATAKAFAEAGATVVEIFAHLPRAISKEGKPTHNYEVGDIAYWSPGP